MYNLAYSSKQSHQLIEKFASAGIHTTSDLLRAGKTAGKRRHLAHSLGLTTRHLMSWLVRADLARIDGIGEEYASLLEAADVRSVNALAECDPRQLNERLSYINRYRKLVRRVPSMAQLKAWILQAQKLPPALDS